MGNGPDRRSVSPLDIMGEGAYLPQVQGEDVLSVDGALDKLSKVSIPCQIDFRAAYLHSRLRTQVWSTTASMWTSARGQASRRRVESRPEVPVGSSVQSSRGGRREERM